MSDHRAIGRGAGHNRFQAISEPPAYNKPGPRKRLSCLRNRGTCPQVPRLIHKPGPKPPNASPPQTDLKGTGNGPPTGEWAGAAQFGGFCGRIFCLSSTLRFFVRCWFGFGSAWVSDLSGTGRAVRARTPEKCPVLPLAHCPIARRRLGKPPDSGAAGSTCGDGPGQTFADGRGGPAQLRARLGHCPGLTPGPQALRLRAARPARVRPQWHRSSGRPAGQATGPVHRSIHRRSAHWSRPPRSSSCQPPWSRRR